MSKKNIQLGIVLVILVAFAYLYQGPWQKWQARRSQPANFFSGLEVKQLDKIVIASNGATTTLEKIGDRWKVGGTKNFFVSLSVAKDIQDKLDQVKNAKLEIAGTNQASKAQFMTDASGAIVKLLGKNQKTLDFVIGKISNDYTGTYVSQVNLDTTYFVNIDLFSVFYQSDWRDKTIFTGDKSKISKLRFQFSGKEYILEKQGDKWQETSPKKIVVSSDKLESILDNMANLSAEAIPEQTFRNTDLEKNLLIVSASGEGVANTIMIGKADKNGLYYAKQADNDNIYLISADQRKTLRPSIESWR